MQTTVIVIKRLARARWRLGVISSVAGFLVSGCEVEMNALDPRGPAATHIATLWWFMFWTGLAVYVAVIGVLLYGTMRGRRGWSTGEPRPFNENLFVAIGGVTVPAAILVAVLVFTAVTERGLLAVSSRADLTIEVVGHQFWWEVRYPDHQFATANEIHIPVGQPVEFRLTSADVIHSLWVPELHGKLDLNPGATNTLVVTADRPGIYRGVCAEFCGLQHTHMFFVVIAEPPEVFEGWLATQRRPAPEPVNAAVRTGQQVFFGAGCNQCHAIQDASSGAATGTVGPDLTHVGSRRTLAAGTIENTRDNMAAWIADPQSIKPGNKMPPANLSEENLSALVAYMESLE